MTTFLAERIRDTSAQQLAVADREHGRVVGPFTVPAPGVKLTLGSEAVFMTRSEASDLVALIQSVIQDG